MSQVDSIEQQVAGFIADKEGEGLSPQTISFYRMTVERLFLPWAQARGILDAGAFTVEDWNAYRNELRGRSLADQSVLTYLRGVRIFLISLGVKTKERGKEFKDPKAAKPLLEPLSREEIDRVEGAADNERDKLVVRTLANTGIRLSELTGLRPKDLREITSPVRYYRIRVWGKGSKEREIWIDKETFKRLETYSKVGGSRAYIFPPFQHDRQADKLVMLDGRLTNNTVDKLFRTLKLRAGITKPCTPHKLRHAFATWALQMGWAIEKLQLQLGHSDLNMILKVYQHLTPDDVSREGERVFNRRGAEEQEEPKKRRRIA